MGDFPDTSGTYSHTYELLLDCQGQIGQDSLGQSFGQSHAPRLRVSQPNRVTVDLSEVPGILMSSIPSFDDVFKSFAPSELGLEIPWVSIGGWLLAVGFWLYACKSRWQVSAVFPSHNPYPCIKFL